MISFPCSVPEVQALRRVIAFLRTSALERLLVRETSPERSSSVFVSNLNVDGMILKIYLAFTFDKCFIKVFVL